MQMSDDDFPFVIGQVIQRPGGCLQCLGVLQCQQVHVINTVVQALFRDRHGATSRTPMIDGRVAYGTEDVRLEITGGATEGQCPGESRMNGIFGIRLAPSHRESIRKELLAALPIKPIQIVRKRHLAPMFLASLHLLPI